MTFLSGIYMICFASLALWLLFKEQKSIRRYFGTAFGASFLIYLGYSLLGLNPLGYIGLIVGLVGLVLGGFVLNIFSNNKILYVSLLGLALMGLWYMPSLPRIPFIFSSSSESTASPSSALAELDPNAELLVEVSNGHQIGELGRIINKYQIQHEQAFELESGASTDLDDYYALNIPESQIANFDEIVNELLESGLIDAVEMNEVIKLDPNENVTDPYQPYRPSYGINDPYMDKVWGFGAMKVDQLYQYMKKEKLQPRKKAKIAILDTGVDAGHEDLRKNFVSTRVEYDEDPHGHGTHCAGIAAAVSNNRKGIASFAPSLDFVEVTSIQVFPRRGGTTQRIIINGMLLAADKGADVISMSLGGPSSDKRQRAYNQAVEYANKKGAIVVVAAGNEDLDARKRVPAAAKGVITVAASDMNNKKASFSNDVSKLKMGLCAPGVNIFSSVPGSKYQHMSGTSMATPYVAGLIGLMKSLEPTLTTEKAFKLLHETGERTASGSSTGKLIQPHAAVKALLEK